MREQVKNIFGKPIKVGEAKPLEYMPEPCEIKATGLLLSNNIEELSLSFDNGTELIFNGLADYDLPYYSPDRRIIKLNQPLTGKLIRGMVKGGDLFNRLPEEYYYKFIGKGRDGHEGRFSILANVYLITQIQEGRQ